MAKTRQPIPIDLQLATTEDMARELATRDLAFVLYTRDHDGKNAIFAQAAGGKKISQEEIISLATTVTLIVKT